jgi:hypothetical protein
MSPVTSVRPGTLPRPQHAAPVVLEKPRLTPPLDLQGLMFAAQMKRREMQQTSAESEVRSIQGKRELETKEARAAMERAEREGAEAADDAKSAAFWKKCACWAGAVAAVAATCCTMGSAAPLAVVAVGVALSASSPYIGEAVKNATGSESAGRWTTFGCALAGAVIQCIGGGVSPAGASTAVQAVGVVASGTAGAATAAEGYKTYQSKKHEANAVEARADAQSARAMAKRSQAALDAVIDELRALEGSIRRALDAVAGAGRELNAGRDRAAMHLARSC